MIYNGEYCAPPIKDDREVRDIIRRFNERLEKESEEGDGEEGQGNYDQEKTR